MQIELECIKRASGLVEILKAYEDDFLYYLNGNKLSLQESLTFRQHSPTGFKHGYAGSGPAQLALAICLKLYPQSAALIVYQHFKRDFIATIPYKEDFLLKQEVPDEPLTYWKIQAQEIEEEPLLSQQEAKLIEEEQKRSSLAKIANKQRIEQNFQQRLHLKGSFRFDFEGLHKIPSYCYLNLIKEEEQTWVIVTDAESEDAGTSVTNGAELVATQLCEQYAIRPYQLRFIERYVRKPLNSYQDNIQETWDEVTFTFHSSGLRHPKWRVLNQEEIKSIESKLH